MPSAIAERASGHKASVDERCSERSSIQPMVPWCPAASQRSRSSPASPVASARVKPQAAKPSRSASARIASLRVALSLTRSHYSVRPELVEGLSLNFLGKAVLRQAQHERLTDEPAVEATDLVKDFGDKRAVDGISLAVPAGSIF